MLSRRCSRYITLIRALLYTPADTAMYCTHHAVTYSGFSNPGVGGWALNYDTAADADSRGTHRHEEDGRPSTKMLETATSFISALESTFPVRQGLLPSRCAPPGSPLLLPPPLPFTRRLDPATHSVELGDLPEVLCFVLLASETRARNRPSFHCERQAKFLYVLTLQSVA